MAVNVGRGYVDIVPDLKGFQDEVAREVETAASKASQRASKAINVGKNLTLGVTVPIAAAFGGAIKMASDLEQSVGGVESIFGDASDQIFEFGDTSAESFGLARQEVNKFATVIGAQLQGMGFEAEKAAEETLRLQERAADMAATFGGDTAQAVEAISALLRGERDTIEKYGVTLKQTDIDARIMALGLDTSTTAAEKQAVAVASLDLLYEQTADAAGQFARESDTVAGAQARAEAKFKDAAAALGTELLPIATDAVEVLSGMVDVFASLPEGVQKGILAVGGVAAAIGPISIVAGGAIKGIQGIRAATNALRTARAATTVANVAEGYSAIGASAASAIPSVKGATRALGRAAVAAGALSAAGHALSNAMGEDAAEQLNAITEEFVHFAETGEVTGDLAQALGDDLRFFADNADRILRPDLWQRGTDALGSMTFGLFNFEDGLENAQTVMQSFDEELSSLVAGGKQEQAAQAFDHLTEIAAKQGITVEELTSLLPGYEAALDDAAVAAAEAGEATEGETEATEKNIDAHEDQKAAIEKAKEAHEAYTDQLRAAVDPVFALNDAFQGVEEAQEAYTEAVKEHGKESAEAEQAAFDLAQATADLEQAAIDGDLSFGAFDQKLADWVAQGKITAEQADIMRERVALLRGEAEDYQGDYNAHMLAETGTASEQIAALERQLFDLTDRRWTVTVDQELGRVVSPPGGGRIPERAGGGPLDMGELALTGEKGAELFVPGAAGQVVSHENSVKQLADAIVSRVRDSTGNAEGVTNHITINNPEPHAAPQDVDRELRIMQLLYR